MKNKFLKITGSISLIFLLYFSIVKADANIQDVVTRCEVSSNSNDNFGGCYILPDGINHNCSLLAIGPECSGVVNVRV